MNATPMIPELDGLQDKMEVAQALAKFLPIFSEWSDERKADILEMASIANAPDAAPDEREAALETIAEALFPSPDVSDLEDLDQEDPDEAALLCRQEETFSQRLAHYMDARSMNQCQLAAATGVGQPAISMMLARNCRPQRRTVEKLAAGLEITPDELWPELFSPSSSEANDPLAIAPEGTSGAAAAAPGSRVRAARPGVRGEKGHHGSASCRNGPSGH